MTKIVSKRHKPFDSVAESIDKVEQFTPNEANFLMNKIRSRTLYAMEKPDAPLPRARTLSMCNLDSGSEAVVPIKLVIAAVKGYNAATAAVGVLRNSTPLMRPDEHLSNGWIDHFLPRADYKR